MQGGFRLWLWSYSTEAVLKPEGTTPTTTWGRHGCLSRHTLLDLTPTVTESADLIPQT